MFLKSYSYFNQVYVGIKFSHSATKGDADTAKVASTLTFNHSNLQTVPHLIIYMKFLR